MMEGRSKIPGSGSFNIALKQLLTKKKITKNRFENMLPGPDCFLIPDFYLFTFNDSPDYIRNETIRRPISSPNHITRSDTCQQHKMIASISFRVKKGIPVR